MIFCITIRSSRRRLREYLRGRVINRIRVRIDWELEETLRSFKPQSSAEMECRRELLRYKRRIDDVVRQLLQGQPDEPDQMEDVPLE